MTARVLPLSGIAMPLLERAGLPPLTATALDKTGIGKKDTSAAGPCDDGGAQHMGRVVEDGAGDELTDQAGEQVSG